MGGRSVPAASALPRARARVWGAELADRDEGRGGRVGPPGQRGLPGQVTVECAGRDFADLRSEDAPDGVAVRWAGGADQTGSGPSSSSTLQGRPWPFSISMNGSGSNCSMLNTPSPRHLPVSIIAAPIIAGTPVV